MCRAKALKFRISNRLLLETLLVAVALSFCLPPLWAQSPDLPPAPVRAKVATACLECHESRIILQQRLGKAAWTKEVDKMIKWGAVVDAADRDAFIDYLSTNFPPDKPPSLCHGRHRRRNVTIHKWIAKRLKRLLVLRLSRATLLHPSSQSAS